jgi:hypothetical protein
MDATKGTVPKTPPESDPRKQDRKMPAGEISPGPEEVEDIRPEDDSAVPPLDKETPGLTGN